jgi:hypothetical protein
MAKDEQENTREKIKRLDDIFRMLLLVITIMLSGGFGRVNLVFILAPLFFWMWGHAVGQFDEDSEILLKFAAWFYTSFIVVVVLIKSALDLSELSMTLKTFSLIVSLLPTAPVIKWLTQEFEEERAHIVRRQLWLIVTSLVLFLFYFYYI